VRVLVVAPHPDDEILGCGGVMARHAAEGDEVHVAVVTRGAPEVYQAEEVNQTRAELKQAHDVLGVKSVRYLDFPAPRMDTIPRHTVADAIRRLVAELTPDTLYAPHYGDMHFEHGLTYEACLVATRPVGKIKVRRVLAYETLSETEWGPPVSGSAFQPTVFVDIGPYLPKKLAAMACIKSQLFTPPHPRSLANLEALATLRGSTAGLSAAEAFMLVREIIA
jgi:LmbE family N-acetylglucosaminyl deacetylase